MSDLDRFGQLLRNYYTRIFEQGKGPNPNRRLSYALSSSGQITLSEDVFAIEENAVGYARYYGDLTVAGADTDGGASAYGITGATQRIQYGEGIFGETTGLPNNARGWIVARIKPNFAFNAALTNNPTLINWGSSANNGIRLRYNNTGDAWSLTRWRSGTAQEVTLPSTHAAGTSLTLAAYWTSMQLAISVNAGAFTTQATVSGASSVNAGMFDIGTSGAPNQDTINASIHWLIIGTGTITQANVATLHAFGDTDPLDWEQIPDFSTLRPSFFWKGVNNTHESPAQYGESNYV